MKLKLYLLLIALISIGFLSSCKHMPNEKQLQQTINGFAQNYFNWHLQASLPYCTPSSKQWIEYAASQIGMGEVEILQKQKCGASHDIKDIEFNEQDSTAIVTVRLKNIMLLDTIGQTGYMAHQADFKIELTYLHNQWKVNLNHIPQPINIENN